MGGKHRLDQRPRGRGLVCIYFGEPTGGEPSSIRECRNCDKQVLVALLLLPLVESGELYPLCRHCNAGRILTMHPVEEVELARRGLLEEGQRLLAEINEYEVAPPPNFIQVRP